MQTDVHPLIQGLLALALALATAAIPLLTRAALTWLHLDGQAGLADRIMAATETGAGLAYQALLAAGRGATAPVQASPSG